MFSALTHPAADAMARDLPSGFIVAAEHPS